ncbi:MAG: haloacid dehalogenase type II [Limnobacter sp.]|uniref:haloacid dehalogenase type II n=1 Tax=Limnobacter sp. TaxID=2003368 RepID=UPI0022C2D1F8|nr:haloacid dehalogenase type II [Limnobacter sp.]MCZ8016172.1 haloacid dehalogenase type II [Limnobacter sp.]
MSHAASAVKALAFDVFGTVVDWRGSVAREVAALARQHHIEVDALAFADAWRAGYAPAMDRVRTGELPWMHIDTLHHMILDSIVSQFGLQGLSDSEREHLNKAWHRLAPWPDTVAGLNALKKQFTITTLSNGNFSLLTAMAKNAGLPWDCIVSAELFKHYKPDPETYHGVASLLNLPIGQVMLCASHPSDLRAAKTQGMRTAYVMRPFEFGEHVPLPKVETGEFDFVAQDFVDLARQLAA